MGTPTPKYKPYPAYKPSGVEWLGDIPEHWEVKHLKFGARINSEKLPGKTDPRFWLKYIDIGNVDANGMVDQIEEYYFDKAPSRARRKVGHDDTIISTVRTYLKAIAYFEHPDENLIVSTGFAVLTPNNIFPRFLWRLVQAKAFVDSVESHSDGVSYPAINPSRLASLPIWLPNLSEQRTIANFLDHQIAKIDALITKKERLIELMEEKRTALISQAVTKGLNPDVEMKASGVEWFGEIPKHWEVIRLRWISRRFSGGTPDRNNHSYWENGEIPWINSGEVNQDIIKQPSTFITREALDNSAAKWFSKDSLVVALAGQGKTKGTVAYLGIKTTGNQSLAAIVPIPKISPKYLYYWIKNNYGLLRGVAGEGKRDGLNLEHLGDLIVFVPDKVEQKVIASYLDIHCSKIETLITKAKVTIEILQEYRTALISAAVTGKIDVREWEAS